VTRFLSNLAVDGRVSVSTQNQALSALLFLISDLRRAASVPPGLETLLAEALRTRNWLAHAYFRERASELMSRAGRDRMINELERARRLFHEADSELNAAFKPVRKKYGFTDARFQALYEELRSKAERDV
jgi:hypothetical protein